MRIMWLFLVGLIIFEAIADYFAKRYQVSDTSFFFFISIVFYIVCNTFWLFSMKNGMTLWEGSVIFSISSAVLGIGIGLLMGEVINTKQYIAILIGIFSIILMES